MKKLRGKSKSGFTLLEVLLATVILVIASTMIMQGFIAVMVLGANNRSFAKSGDYNYRLAINQALVGHATASNQIADITSMTDNTYVLELKNDIQLLTHKIDLLQLNKFEYTASVPKHNEICSNVPEIKQTGQHSSGSLASEKSHIDEEKALDNKIVPSTSLNGGNQSATDVKAKTFSNDFIVEQYRSEVKKFVDDYNTRLLPTSSDIKLIVFPDDKKRLSKNNFDSWCEIEDIDKICLIETSGTYSYQAQRLNIDNGCGNQYFLVAPNMLISNFTKTNATMGLL